jgi:hypothetical protein
LGSEIIDYEGYVMKKSGKKIIHNSLAIACKAIITKNITFSEDRYVFNG